MKRESNWKPAKESRQPISKATRSSDPNALRSPVGKKTTERLEDSPTDAEILRVMATLGRKAVKIGGKRRMDAQWRCWKTRTGLESPA